ncbi:MAG TPA: nucleotidyltransferase domain-containing protein [Gammaproteobacteria bacterium]
MKTASIGDALFTKTQQRVLGLLFGSPDKRYYTNEIVRLAGMGRGTVRRELERLVSAGLLEMMPEGNQHYYRANKQCPIFSALVEIVKKTFGVVDVIRQGLSPLADRIDWAFIFGSVASGKETASSDIDLMIIGEPGFAEVVAALYPVQESLGREINPKVFTKDEWIQKRSSNDAFIKDVLNKPRMDVMGGGNESG